MAIHLNNEPDSVQVTQILCNHRLFEGQPKIIDIDGVDNAGNSPLHHAALTNKLILCKYLIEEQMVSHTILNSSNLLAIDLTTSKDVENYLSQY